MWNNESVPDIYKVVGLTLNMWQNFFLPILQYVDLGAKNSQLTESGILNTAFNGCFVTLI